MKRVPLDRTLLLLAFALGACGGESAHEAGARAVSRAEFHAVRLRATEQDVRRALGEPDANPAGAGTIWRYRVREQRRGLDRRLLRLPPRETREWVGDISFRDGLVIKKALSPLPSNDSARPRNVP